MTLLLVYLLGALAISFLCSILEAVLMSTPLSYTSVINQMGAMKGRSFFGVIMFIIVFLLGHTLNLAINVLGAYVHTNRLQFVEFFGKFYEGGGTAFKPFTTPTKYIKITEDK